MSLKTLIIIKFFVYIISISYYIYLTNNLFSYYDDIEKKNIVLLEEKLSYEHILKIDPKNIEDRKNAYEDIKKLDLSLKPNNEIKTLSINECINLMLLYFIITYNIFSYLDKKIEIKKAEEPESERKNFL